MRRAGCAALAAAAGFVLAATSARAEDVAVIVIDRLSAGQVEETISVTLAGRAVGTLHIDADHPEDQISATVPRAAQTPYILCGKLLRREHDGSVTTHRIDNGGVLGDIAGTILFANTLGDVLFSLEDSEGGGRGDVHPGPACDAVISLR